MVLLLVALSKMVYVTIDFSLNSPGICIFNDKTQQYHFISYLKSGLGTKKEQKIQEDLKNLKGVTLYYQPDFSNSKTYSSAELAKINRYVTTADKIINLIKDIVQDMDEFVFAFEGTSYGSNGGTNNMIDMAAGAAILKLKILENFSPITIETVAPSTIKKHAGKGNMNKAQLWKVFLDNTLEDKIIGESEMHSFCVNEVGETSKIPKPFDDLVDAYFLNAYLKSTFYLQA